MRLANSDADLSCRSLIQNVTHLLRARRFLPLFATQFLGAFNDSLFKQAVVLFVTYQLYSNPAKEFQFSAIAQGLFILPFFLFSAFAGQITDADIATLVRYLKGDYFRPEAPVDSRARAVAGGR